VNVTPGGKMYIQDSDFLNKCRLLLIAQREDTLQHLSVLNNALKWHQKEDQAGEVQSLQMESLHMTQSSSLSGKLKKIDEALSRIEIGSYGICLETEEPIEKDRLLAVPWTNLSLSGAEIVERKGKGRSK
jgi:DnaK suppressor protein